MQEDNEKLFYKNSDVFYKRLYERLFGLINDIIDENKFNVNSIKDKVNDFTNSYSYYVVGKSPVKSKEEEPLAENDETLLIKIKEFDSFTQSLNKYPSEEYIKARAELKLRDYDLSKVTTKQFETIFIEYYHFFDEVIDIIKDFVNISSINGFLPILKSKKSLRTIGFANYDLFFLQLENLKTKLSNITTSIKVNNMFKTRRCAYCVLIVLSPYFKRKGLFNKFRNDLNFDFLDNEKDLIAINKCYQYETILSLPTNYRETIKEIVTPFKTNVDYIKRYISFELGEIDLSPKIKKKYLYDPTWT